ncbi:MAG: hypothetical protein HQ593_04255 [Candidatus Omnitrophica bacterium]|nr:hypothetical protein [Candidatus Omnitrophota bacterium]
MIVPMKKVTVVVQSKDADSTLKELGRLGVLHIEHQKAPASDNIRELTLKYQSLLKAIEFLPETKGQNRAVRGEPQALIDQIISLTDEKEVVTENLKKVNQNIEEWKDWGDFSPEEIEDLEYENVRIQLCKITAKQFKNMPEGVIVEEIFRKGNIRYCAVISHEEVELPFKVLDLPEESLSQMLASRGEREDRIKLIEKRLLELAGQKEKLLLYKKHLESLIEFDQALTGMGQFEKLLYLRGYCPDENIKILEKTATDQKWGLLVEDPGDDDSVPTLIKNPRWVEIIRPVFQLINTIPGYKEVDISMWFLLFFSVFFGMLIGDAGYGLVFFIINAVCHVKFRKSETAKPLFILMYALSICAMIWGVLSGTFFGQAYLAKRVEPLLPLLRNNNNVQALCFFIGALHLSIAHAWRFLRNLPSVKALSEAGWICMLWAAYFLAKSLILGGVFPELGKGLFITGAALIILFTSPRKNVLKGIGSGVGELLMRIVNSFTDVVSYIRLFAVGAATVAVADAFNQMASGVGGNSILAGFAAALILLFGHTLNILLGAMAILVHGVRLNVLEFSSHLNMEWSGMEYSPFKNKGD